MKKWKLVAALVLCMALLLPAWAVAEEVPGIARIDWTDVVIAGIRLAMVALGVVFVFGWNKHIKPWLEQHNLMDAAKIAVGAAEALFGRYHGVEKMDMALRSLKNQGFNIDSELVIQALQAAWKDLDLQQMIAGEKEKPPEPMTMGEESPGQV